MSSTFEGGGEAYKYVAKPEQYDNQWSIVCDSFEHKNGTSFPKASAYCT